ncbi:hypothetical protein [Brumimicrobium sp.]|uniref:hypothetical protein n=1 Tax=Brumimicrobium sp. TaxID=2029867 RepID=UPI003A9546D2
MIRLIQIFFIFCIFNLTAQNGNVVIVFPNSAVLYEAYSSVLKVGFTKKKIRKFILECEGCDTIYQKSENDPTEFVLTPGSVNKVVLKLKDPRKNTILERLEIKVTKPPAPTLKIDHHDSQYKVKNIPENLYLEKPKDLPIISEYFILSWTIKINDTVLKGFTSKLTEEVKNYIQQKNKGIMRIEVIYRDVYGKQEMNEFFEFEL